MFGSGRITGFSNRAVTPVTNTPTPTFSVTTNILSGSSVRWDIDTNLTQEQTLYYIIEGATTADLQGLPVSGSFAVDIDGNYQLDRNLQSNIDIGVDKSFQFRLYSNDSYSDLLATGTNVDVRSQTGVTATGGNITYNESGTLAIHTFDTPGNTTFTLSSIGNYDWTVFDLFRTLIVGGGGGGGNTIVLSGTAYYAGAGGGGGGGFLQSNVRLVDMITTSYSVSVGTGGNVFQNGANSAFGSNVAIGGGRGGGSVSTTTINAGANGGSGGGGAADTLPTRSLAGGTGTAGPPRQGYNGSAGYASSIGPLELGGGGGGAGSAGTAPILTPTNSIRPGSGGNGAISNITGANVYYAGGGGGNRGQLQNASIGFGGIGGGGNAFVAGTNGLGGGGGAGSAGGSGIVIVTYPKISEYRYFTAP